MLRNVGTVIAGMVVGSVANMAVVISMTLIWPLPEGTDMSDPVAMAPYIAAMPAAAWLMVMFAHLLQAFTGGWVAARLGASHPMELALIIGGLSMLGGVMNAINLSAPAWLWIEMPLYFVAAGAAGWLEQKRRAGLSPS